MNRSFLGDPGHGKWGGFYEREGVWFRPLFFGVSGFQHFGPEPWSNPNLQREMTSESRIVMKYLPLRRRVDGS